MTQPEQTSPDELMDTFKGHSMKKIVVFTIIVHAVLILGTSASFLYKSFVGDDATEKPQEERMEEAVREATISLKEIAEKHGLKAQELSSQFASKKPKAPEAPAAEVKEPDAATPTDPTAEATDPEKPLSSIEKELKKTETGPDLPPVEDVDLFK